MSTWRPVRIIRPELLDTIDPALAGHSLRDLVRINRWLGGYRVLLSVLAELVRPDEAFSLLDIGAASGETARVIKRRYTNASIVSLDRRASHLLGALPPRVAADAFQLPFREAAFDFVHCSLFLHHFSDDEVTILLKSLPQFARRAFIAIDLQRSAVAYVFLPLTRWLFRWDAITVHDGRISVESAFFKSELESLAKAAGLAGARVRVHHPWFRLSLVSPGIRVSPLPPS